MKGHIHFTLLTIGALLFIASCQKDNNPPIDNPPAQVDSTYHVFGMRIDSGFVFGQWELVCYNTTAVNNTPPYHIITTNNCAEHPLYNFEPEGLVFISGQNPQGGTTLIDSAIYWYTAAENNLTIVGYRIETGPNNDKKYVVDGPFSQQTVTYSNDSMYWLQNTGGSASSNRSFVRKD